MGMMDDIRKAMNPEAAKPEIKQVVVESTADAKIKALIEAKKAEGVMIKEEILDEKKCGDKDDKVKLGGVTPVDLNPKTDPVTTQDVKPADDKKKKVVAKEETINELSQSRLRRYINKARKDKKIQFTKPRTDDKSNQKYVNRTFGIEDAQKRLGEENIDEVKFMSKDDIKGKTHKHIGDQTNDNFTRDDARKFHKWAIDNKSNALSFKMAARAKQMQTQLDATAKRRMKAVNEISILKGSFDHWKNQFEGVITRTEKRGNETHAFKKDVHVGTYYHDKGHGSIDEAKYHLRTKTGKVVCNNHGGHNSLPAERFNALEDHERCTKCQTYFKEAVNEGLLGAVKFLGKAAGAVASNALDQGVGKFPASVLKGTTKALFKRDFKMKQKSNKLPRSSKPAKSEFKIKSASAKKDKPTMSIDNTQPEKVDRKKFAAGLKASGNDLKKVTSLMDERNILLKVLHESGMGAWHYQTLNKHNDLTYQQHYDKAIEHHNKGIEAKSNPETKNSAATHFRTRDKHFMRYAHSAPLEHIKKLKMDKVKEMLSVRESVSAIDKLLSVRKKLNNEEITPEKMAKWMKMQKQHHQQSEYNMKKKDAEAKKEVKESAELGSKHTRAKISRVSGGFNVWSPKHGALGNFKTLRDAQKKKDAHNDKLHVLIADLKPKPRDEVKTRGFKKFRSGTVKEDVLNETDITHYEKHEIEPNREHHQAMVRAGLKHLSSEHVKQTSKVMKSSLHGDHHAWEANPGSHSKYDAIGNRLPNLKRSKMIRDVVKHFKDRGYTHHATKGKSGIHYFARRGPRDKSQFEEAMDTATMTTRHGSVHVHHKFYTKSWNEK